MRPLRWLWLLLLVAATAAADPAPPPPPVVGDTDEAEPAPVAPSSPPPAVATQTAAPRPAPLADRTPLQAPEREACRAAHDTGAWLWAARCWESVLRTADDPDQKLRAVALEALMRLDEAAAVWRPWLDRSSGEARIGLERRINALAEAELALDDLTAKRAKPFAAHLQSIMTDVYLSNVKSWGDVPPWLTTLGRPQQGPLWQRGMAGSGDEVPVGVVPLPQGGAWIAARANLHEHGGYKLRLYRVDASGRPRSQMTWGSGGDDEPRTLLLAGDRVAIGGRTNRSGKVQGWLAVFDGQRRPVLDVTVEGCDDVLALQPDRDGWLAKVATGTTTTVLRIQADGKAAPLTDITPNASKDGKKAKTKPSKPPQWPEPQPLLTQQGDSTQLTLRRGRQVKLDSRQAVAHRAADGDIWVVLSSPAPGGRRELLLQRWRP